MSVKIPYGKIPADIPESAMAGREVSLYKLTGAGGAEAEIMDYCATIRSIIVPDRAGEKTDVVMGFETFDDQFQSTGWNCGIVGRVANRIDKGDFFINGKRYTVDLPEQDGQKAPFILHSGAENYAKKLFQGKLWSDSEGEKAEFYYRDVSAIGFPGVADVWVTYVLTPDNELQLRYRCLPSEDTVLNITSHCYFNLAGHGSGGGALYDHVMKLDAGYYLPARPDCLPTGEVHKVDGTAFDFREPAKLGDGMKGGDPQIALFGGYDHNFCLSGAGYRECGWVYAEQTGIKMTVSTDLPGIQLYTSCSEVHTEGAKDGKTYERFGALCLETQYYPNATAHSHFPQPVFPANQVFESQTAYKFSVQR